MCIDDKCDAPETDKELNRRSFLAGSTAALVGVVMGSEILAQQTIQPPTKALKDPNIVQGIVSFKSGAEMIQGYQARPKTTGKRGAVVVLHGNLGIPEDHRYTAAQLAQAGFAALAVKRFSRTPELTIEELNQSDRSDRRYLSGKFNRQELSDAQAAIDYLKSQSFVRRGKIGIIGFCGGGYQSLLLATESKDVKAVVAFYAPPIIGEQYQVAEDPKPNLMDVVSKIKVPVQGHYGTADTAVPVADVKKFEQALQKQGTPAEIFFYEGARHAFCDYTRRNYDAEAAALAKSRMFEFLKRRLK
jgi:carboxymethylenebutenolidase